MKNAVKKAVIVVGSHHAGKSKTIREYFKPLVGISGNRRIFQIGSHCGVVRSQSLEECFGNGHVMSQTLEERGVENVAGVVADHQHYERLVFAARPSDEDPSFYETLKCELESRDYLVFTVTVAKGQPESFYERRGQEVFEHLQ